MKKFNLLGAIFVGSLFVCANIYHTVESSNKNQSDVYKISNNVVNGVNGRSDYLNKYLIFLKKIKNNTTYQNVLLFQSVDNENLLFKNVDNNYVNVFNESTKSSFSLYFINDNFSINQNIKNNYNYLISTLNNKLNLKDTKNYDEVVQDFDYQTNNYFDFDGSLTSKDKSSQRKFNGVLRDENFINFNVNSFDQNLSTGWGFWKIFQVVIAAIGAIIMIICGMYSLAGYLGAFSGGEALAGGASAAAGAESGAAGGAIAGAEGAVSGAEGAEAGSTGGIATGTGSGVNGAIQDANAVGETIRNAINTASGVGNIERFFRWFRCGGSNSNESSLQMDHIIEWDSVNSDNSENLLNELNDLTNNNVGSGMQDRIDGLEDNVSITSNVADNQSEESWYDIDLHSRDNDLHSDYEQIPENVGGNRASSTFDSLKNWFHNSVGRVGGKFKRFFNFRGRKNNNNDIITELQARLDALRENADVTSGRNSTSLDDLLNTNHNLNEHMDLKASESSDEILYNFDNANNVINRPENPELNENFNSFNTNNFGSTNNEISNNSFDFGSQTDTNDIIDELQARIEAMKENISDYLNNLPNNNVESGIQDRIDGFGDNVSITSNKSEIDISGIYDDINLHSDYEQIPENVGGKNNNNDIITELQARLDALRENADVTSGRNSTSLDDLLNTNHTENNVGDPNDFNMQTDNEIYNDDFFDRLEARLDALRNNDTVPSGQNSNNLDDLLNTNHAENNVGETSDFNMQTDNVDTNDSIVQTNNNIIDTNDSVAQTNNNSIDTKDFVSQTDNVDTKDFVAQTENVDTNDSIVQTNNNSIDTKDFVAQTENVDTKDFVAQTENVDTNDSIVQTNNNSIDTKDFVAQTENVDTKDFVSQTENVDTNDSIVQTNNNSVDTKDFVVQTENVNTKDFVAQTDNVDTKDFVSQTENVDTKDFVAQTDNVDTKDFVAQTENVDTNDSIVQTNNNSIDTKDFVAQTENVVTEHNNVGTQVYDDEFFKDDRGSFNTWEMDGYKNSEESIADQENNYTRSNPELFSSSMNHNPELSSTRSNPELFSSYTNHNPELSSTRSSNFIEDNPLFDYDEKFSPVNDGYGSSSEENYNFRINNWRKDDFYTTAYLSDSQEELSNNQNNVQINLEGQTTKTSDDLVSQLQENNAFYDNKETHTNINVENPGSQAESELNESGISESQENNESFSDNYTLRENFDNQSLETNSKGGEFDEQKFQEWYLNNQESIQQGIFGNFRNSSSSNYIPRGSSTGEVMVNAEGTSLEHDFDPLSANFEDEIEIENNIDLNINYSTPSASGGGYDIVVTEGEIQPFLTEL